MKKINKTLNEKLFQSPEFDNDKIFHFYNSLRHRMFPDELLFQKLLTADTLDEQYEYAAKIISKIIYESNYPPSNQCLLDVLTLESSLKEKKINEKSHIARDHYIHSIYVYLMGIYIFFYNSTFYNFITSHYRYARESSSYENDEICCIKDFISAWKYFSFYHDVGYQTEILTSMNHTKFNKTIKEYPFFHAFDADWQKYYFCTQNAVKILTRILLVGKIIEDAKNDKFIYEQFILRLKSENFSKYLTEEKVFVRASSKDIEDCFKQKNILYLRKVHSNRAMKTIIAILGIENVIIVGKDSYTGHILFVSKSDGKDMTIFCANNHKIPEEIMENPNLLLLDDYHNDNIEFSYFASIELWNTSLQNVFSSLQNLLNKIENKFIRISNDKDFITYEYTLYDLLYHETSFIFNLPKSYHKALFDILKKNQSERIIALADLNKKNIKYLSDQYLNDITSSVKQILLHLIEQDNTYTEYKSEKKPKNIDDLLSSHIQSVFDSINNMFVISKEATRKSMKHLLSQAYNEKLNEKGTLWTQLINIYINLAAALSDYTPDFSFDYKSKKEIVNYTSMQNILEPHIMNHHDCFRNGLNEFIFSYKPPYNISHDHGMYASYYFINNFNMYMHITKNSVLIDNRYVYILFNMSFPCNEFFMRYQKNYEHIIKDVAYTIFIHNLYPECFTGDEKKKFRTNINTPFTYLALLCDFLQNWNRPHVQHPTSFILRPNNDTSEAFDIQIQNGYIHIQECKTENAQQQLNKNLSTLEQYLDLPHSFICNADFYK